MVSQPIPSHNPGCNSKHGAYWCGPLCWISKRIDNFHTDLFQLIFYLVMVFMKWIASEVGYGFCQIVK